MSSESGARQCTRKQTARARAGAAAASTHTHQLAQRACAIIKRLEAARRRTRLVQQPSACCGWARPCRLHTPTPTPAPPWLSTDERASAQRFMRPSRLAAREFRLRGCMCSHVHRRSGSCAHTCSGRAWGHTSRSVLGRGTVHRRHRTSGAVAADERSAMKPSRRARCSRERASPRRARTRRAAHLLSGGLRGPSPSAEFDGQLEGLEGCRPHQ